MIGRILLDRLRRHFDDFDPSRRPFSRIVLRRRNSEPNSLPDRFRGLFRMGLPTYLFAINELCMGDFDPTNGAIRRLQVQPCVGILGYRILNQRSAEGSGNGESCDGGEDNRCREQRFHEV